MAASRSAYPTYGTKALPRSAAGSPVGAKAPTRTNRNLDGPKVRDAGKEPKPAGRIAAMRPAKAYTGSGTRVTNPPVRLPNTTPRGGMALMSASRKKGAGTPITDTGGATAY